MSPLPRPAALWARPFARPPQTATSRPRTIVRLGTGLAPLAAGLVGCAATARRPALPEGPPDHTFVAPRCASVRGYTGDAMEPFATRDGRFLLFNSSNAPGAQTDLHVARVADDGAGGLALTYVGPLQGANSDALDAVPSESADGTLYFVSTRSYSTAGATIYAARRTGATVGPPALVGGLPREPGVVLFDVEVSADGRRLYYSRGVFAGGPAPRAAELRAAVRRDGGFVPDSAEIAALAAVNAPDALTYAAALSADARELLFTRAAGGPPAIYRAVRAAPGAPFGPPGRLAELDGFVEAPALSPDGAFLYYHRRIANHFALCRARRR